MLDCLWGRLKIPVPVVVSPNVAKKRKCATSKVTVGVIGARSEVWFAPNLEALNALDSSPATDSSLFNTHWVGEPWPFHADVRINTPEPTNAGRDIENCASDSDFSSP